MYVSNFKILLVLAVPSDESVHDNRICDFKMVLVCENVYSEDSGGASTAVSHELLRPEGFELNTRRQTYGSLHAYWTVTGVPVLTFTLVTVEG